VTSNIYASKALLKRVIFDLVHEEDQPAVARAVSNACAHVAETSVICKTRRSDGALRWVRSFISAQLEDASNVDSLRHKGSPLGIVTLTVGIKRWSLSIIKKFYERAVTTVNDKSLIASPSAEYVA